jgi:cystathionine beta-lyase/cystathionine gamma-synthase
LKMETKAVHAGRGVDPATGAVTPPIHLSTTCVVGLEHPDDLTEDLARALGPAKW